MVVCNQTEWLGENGKKKCFTDKGDEYDLQVAAVLGTFVGNPNFSNYVRRGGISYNDETDAEYNNVQNAIKDASRKLKQYEDLTNELSVYIKDYVSSATQENATTTPQEIAALQKKIKDAKTDYENAKSRQENVENPRKHVSNYQGLAGKLGFSKPFHKVSIAIFLALGILFICLSFMMVREILNKPDAASVINTVANNTGVGSIFSNTLLTLVGVVFLFVLLGLFASSGKF